MLRAFGTALVLAALSAAVIFTVPASSAADYPVEVRYYKDPSIEVAIDFEGNTMIIFAYSEKYDLGVSGIMLYTFDSNGKTDFTTNGRPPSRQSVSDEGVHTFTFYNVTEGVEVNFSDLIPLESWENSQEEQAKQAMNEGRKEAENVTAVILLAAVIGGAIVIVFMTLFLRMLDLPAKRTGMMI